MSNNEFEQGPSLSQGIVDAASQEPQPTAANTTGGNDCLPGFERYVERPAEKPAPSETPAADAAPPTKFAAAAWLPSPGKAFLCALCAASAGVAVVAAHRLIRPRTVIREVFREVKVESDAVPVALLPDTADPSLWPVVSDMSGLIDGKPVFFKNGIAVTKDGDYRVCLDFCLSGADVYARVTGNGAWVVKVTPEGKIVKAYPSPREGKPLKELLGGR